MEQIIKKGYKCKRCLYEWIPRIKINELPITCPSCNSPYWNKYKRIKED